eukprot:CAMPEP_0117650282 /NCGR_PEP_ID=MMETSP0804-20121206/1457_1 /TAXON_ID=1074897 /ORGANISM="Tetraselmis astigmatica, Strain CCMP880" /LENGTH=363 /DNA_ID=CAMNT_0005456145 /DNA_START=221 /DNA_END=1312 /DNA_ORIENTATION=+
MAGDADAEALSLVFKTRGLRVAAAGDLTGALLLFRKALELQDRSAAVHEMCAQCLMELERWDEAFEAAMSANSCDPQWLDGTVTLARAARNAGYLKESLQAYRTATGHSDNQDQELAAELSEVEGLWQRDLALRVGVDGLQIHEDWDGSALSSAAASTDGSLGPGGVVWDCGIAMAQSLRAGWPVNLAGTRVLEIGSGTGIVGIAAAASGAAVTLTDVEGRVPILQANMDCNQQVVSAAGGSMLVAALDWGDPGTAATLLQLQTAAPKAAELPKAPGWDVIIGADLVYSSNVLLPLTTVLKRILSISPAQFFMAHKSRSEALDSEMISAMRAEGIQLRKLSWPSEFAAAWDNKVTVYSFEPSA